MATNQQFDPTGWIQYPLLIDGCGNLYFLVEDGTTRKVPQFGHGYTERALSIGTTLVGPFVCTNQYLSVFLVTDLQWVQKPLGPMGIATSIGYPDILVINDSDHSLIVINGKSEIFCSQIAKDCNQDWTIPTNTLIYTGWFSDNDYFLAGMIPRVTNNLLPEKWGQPVILRSNKDRWRIEQFDSTSVVEGIYERKYPKQRDRTAAKRDWPSLKLEACLDSIAVCGEQWLICPVISEDFDPYLLDLERLPGACIGDFGAMACITYQDVPRLIEYIPEYTYACKIQMEINAYLYFPHSSLKIHDQTLRMKCMVIHRNEPEYKIHNGGISGLSQGKEAFFFRFYYDARVGFYGSVGVFVDGGKVYFLIRSKDGISWQAMHTLCEYQRE